VPYTGDFYLIADDQCADCIDEAVVDLAMIGLDKIAGYFGTEVVAGWAEQEGELQTVPQIDVDTLEARMERGEVAVLDVRGATEAEAGRIAGVPNIPLGYLSDRLDEVPTGKPLVLHCAAGGRSAIGVSLLQARGFDDVHNLTGGFTAWKKADKPAVSGPVEAEAVGV
jgi:hydroxyacylglutathione hydrolase